MQWNVPVEIPAPCKLQIRPSLVAQLIFTFKIQPGKPSGDCSGRCCSEDPGSHSGRRGTFCGKIVSKRNKIVKFSIQIIKWTSCGETLSSLQFPSSNIKSSSTIFSQCPFHWVISFSPYQMFHPMPCRVVEGGVVLVSLGTNNVFFCSIVSILFHEFLVNMPLDAKFHLSIADVWIKLTAKFPWALVHLGGRFFYRIRGTDIIMKTYIEIY